MTRRIAKIAVAGLLFGIPLVTVSIPAFTAPDGVPTVLGAPLPAEPPTIAPPPPTPPSPVNYTEDWWGYGDAGGGGGAGGGG